MVTSDKLCVAQETAKNVSSAISNARSSHCTNAPRILPCAPSSYLHESATGKTPGQSTPAPSSYLQRSIDHRLPPSQSKTRDPHPHGGTARAVQYRRTPFQLATPVYHCSWHCNRHCFVYLGCLSFDTVQESSGPGHGHATKLPTADACTSSEFSTKRVLVLVCTA